MNSIVKPYLVRASLLAGLVIIFGVGLSVLVYVSTNKVQENAVELVENRIPILTSVNQMIADLNEQERIIYEYYRSQEPAKFLSNSTSIRSAFNMHSTALLNQSKYRSQTMEILQGQKEIELLFSHFHQAMEKDEDNWDELRDILSKVSNIRLSLLPKLIDIENFTKADVEEGHTKTLAQMNTTHWVVVAYGVVLLLFSAIASIYIRRYILIQAKNTRLALFSHQNPDPIISINNVGEIIFANPACETLLKSVGYHQKDIQQLLPSNFYDVRAKLTKTESKTVNFEQELKDKILHINVNWHKDIDAYDIHIRDITERKLAEQNVKHLAFYAQETNLPNQYKLNNDLDEMINEDRVFSLGILAIRHFEQKASLMSVDAISALLKVLTRTIANQLPSSIGFYQLNDSKLALVCTDSINHLAIQKLVKKVVSSSSHNLNTEFGEFFVELDFGFSCFPQHGDDHNSLQKHAQIALTIASESEHENLSIYQSNMSDCINKDTILTDSLRSAVELNELFLVFQPQLNIQQNKITGCETLVRWRHNGEIVSPADFIPLAESSGLIVEIGQWILEQACFFAKQMINKGDKDFVIAVNVSPRQFSHPQFSQMVLQTLSLTGLPARNLELEITEGVFMHNETHTISVLHHLKSTGIQLSIDDFGTGYSSLSYLKRLPIDKLKIDQSFIKDCHNSEDDRAIIDTIVALGKSLSLALIAEGVEEEEHLNFLRDLHCDEIQGYWFSRPLEPQDFENFYFQHRGNTKQLLTS